MGSFSKQQQDKNRVTDKQDIQYKDKIEYKSLNSKQTEELKPIIHSMCLSLKALGL